MGKGQVSEQELAQGIKSLGGLGGLTSGVSRRDSPFGSAFVRKPQPTTEVLPEMRVEKELTDKPNAEQEAFQKEEPKRQVKGPAVAVEVQEKKSTASKSVQHPSAEEGKGEDRATARFEAVTFKMTAEMRDDLQFIAKKLQRRRKSKEVRITSNTVIRVACQFLLDELKLNDTDFVNNEEELLALAKRKLLRK